MDSLRPHLDLLKAMGSPVLVFAEVTGAVHGNLNTRLSQRPVLNEWREFGRRMTEIARRTAAEGVQLAYHHHMGTVVQSESDIHELMAATGPEVGLLLDTGHATYAGADPVALAKRYRDRIRHIHTKDVRIEVRDRALKEDWSFLHAVVEGVFTVPGDGDVAFDRVFRELRGYSGWVVLEAEQDPDKANPKEYAAKGFAELKKLIARDLT